MKLALMILSLCAVLALSTTIGIAKRTTIGIYAIVDKVEFEPDENSPERIRIWGVFVVPVPMSSGQYKASQRGYLYFSIAPGMEGVVKQEWSDLKAFAGTGQGIGFGQYWVANPADPSGNPHQSLKVKVHSEGVAVVPDVYPMPHARGILKNGDKADPDFETIMTQLQKAARD
jgi:hypothetical protein